MASISRNELQDLVDNPSETLSVEYKSWLDLGDNGVKAALARHIAALANHGGGMIVFGITDDMQPDTSTPSKVDRDIISGVVKRYLEPPFQCDVVEVQSTAGNKHPVVIVPAHGASPICAKRSGPNSQGLIQGTYYIRKPGPASEGITTSAEWAPLIRRCAMHERASILGAIDAALRGTTAAAPDEAAKLKQWHDAAHEAFLPFAQAQTQMPLLVKNHWQFSYSIVSSDGQKLDPNQLSNILRQVNNETQDLVRTGWSMFYQFSRPPLEPNFNTDPKTGLGEDDFLECALLREPREYGADFWRVSPVGKVSLVREYWEDTPDVTQGMRIKAGTIFSPNMMSQALAEFVRHAQGFAERFTEATAVFFHCEWWGLQGRIVADPIGTWSPHPPSRTDHRVSTGSWPIGSLTSDLTKIVAELGAPVARALDVGDTFGPQWVEGQRKRWLR